MTGEDQSQPYKRFPTAKFVITISAPVILTVLKTQVNNAWQEFVVPSSTLTNTSQTERTATKKSKIKLLSLMQKMLNRLIREEIVPFEAISVLTGPTSFFARILVAPNAVPIVMLRCEHIGIGNQVGLCYVSSVDSALIPPAISGPTREVELEPFADKIANTAQLAGAVSPSESEPQSIDDSDDFSDAVSSEFEGERKEPQSPIVEFTSSNIPLLSEERKRKLNEDVANARKEWLDNASRVRVEQVVEEVSAGAAFTLDYMAFVICASMVAAVGLAVDSATTVIASMLISPIMGPVMGFTFGTAVREKALIRKSFCNEIWSLVICVLIGAIAGVLITVAGVPDLRDWPSAEMLSRGDPTGLVSGVLIAIPSGVAVSLGTLGKNSSGMVGVAISLSLLPPAVNAGICWFYALMLKSDKYNRNTGDDTDYAENGTVSFILTSVNILCIWLAGVFTFWIKEVAPVKQKSAFWSKDIAVYRETKDSDGGADLAVLNDGIKATLELQENAAARGEIYKDDTVVGGRRLSTLAGANDDALLRSVRVLDNQEEPKAAGVPEVIERARNDLTLSEQETKRSLLQNANKFGGLEEAGEALFETNATGLTMSPTGTDTTT